MRPTGIDIGFGVETAGTVRLNTQGGLMATENQLDLARVQNANKLLTSAEDARLNFQQADVVRVIAHGAQYKWDDHSGAGDLDHAALLCGKRLHGCCHRSLLQHALCHDPRLKEAKRSAGGQRKTS